MPQRNSQKPKLGELPAATNCHSTARSTAQAISSQVAALGKGSRWSLHPATTRQAVPLSYTVLIIPRNQKIQVSLRGPLKYKREKIAVLATHASHGSATFAFDQEADSGFSKLPNYLDESRWRDSAVHIRWTSRSCHNPKFRAIFHFLDNFPSLLSKPLKSWRGHAVRLPRGPCSVSRAWHSKRLWNFPRSCHRQSGNFKLSSFHLSCAFPTIIPYHAIPPPSCHSVDGNWGSWGGSTVSQLGHCQTRSLGSLIHYKFVQFRLRSAPQKYHQSQWASRDGLLGTLPHSAVYAGIVY